MYGRVSIPTILHEAVRSAVYVAEGQAVVPSGRAVECRRVGGATSELRMSRLPAKEQAMRILVAYYTLTKNTEKVAQAIHAEALAQGHAADLTRFRRRLPETLDEYEIVFVGSPCHHSDLAKPVKKLLSNLPSATIRLAGFATHATYLPEGSERRRTLHQEWAGRCVKSFEDACRKRSIHWSGYFGCQGAPSKPIELFIHRAIFKDRDEWAEYIAEARKHPTEEDLENARSFARDVLEESD